MVYLSSKIFPCFATTKNALIFPYSHVCFVFDGSIYCLKSSIEKYDWLGGPRLFIVRKTTLSLSF